MRLLQLQDDGDFSLVEYVGNSIPHYAILSHTWGPDDEEVTFRDLTDGTGRGKTGYRKLTFCGKQATCDGLQFFWVDTCCIDKSSSAELSEAINSMFHWYQRANWYYAFLDDVCADADLDSTLSQFKKCRWFTRGWTLQELIAPDNLKFYAQNWTPIGSKITHCSVISEVTGIPISVLLGRGLQTASIAKRISWAANRQTERTEDKAYCLIGILDVNMPMLYGEGEKAFIRLQERIIKCSLDHSLFAWPDRRSSESEGRGVLARSPADFSGSGHIVPYPSSGTAPYAMTNKGLQINLTLFSAEDAGTVQYALLRC
ncbi:HET-domain-containing protein, partial [Zopfia rhizophila CBS 207.26]